MEFQSKLKPIDVLSSLADEAAAHMNGQNFILTREKLESLDHETLLTLASYGVIPLFDTIYASLAQLPTTSKSGISRVN